LRNGCWEDWARRSSEYIYVCLDVCGAMRNYSRPRLNE
jgi:hypothetical protein